MIRHCVLFRFKDGTTDDDKAAVKAALVPMAELPMIISYAFGEDLALAAPNYDFAIVADVASVDDYWAYQNHPAHKQVATEVVSPRIAERVAVQFELPG